MFIRISHNEGVQEEREILFSTPFGYMFPEAAKSRQCLLPPTEITLDGLRRLGSAMAFPEDPPAFSPIPAIFTYLGQFIDHDITARTDRDTTSSSIGAGEPIIPLAPDTVIEILRNGRRPQLDLDSVFGDGPNLLEAPRSCSDPDKQQDIGAQVLYDADYKLCLFEDGTRYDLPRKGVTDAFGNKTFIARIADMRNDENVNISQLHMAVIRFYNAVYDEQSGSNQKKYIRARQLTRWAYQYLVVNEYLMTVCDQAIVEDTLANGPRFIGSTAGKGDAFMPLEFSTAAFRFGHSMIRSAYTLNNTSANIPLIAPDGQFRILGAGDNAVNFGPDDQLKADLIIDWSNFIGSTAQTTRKIDTVIARGLNDLPFHPNDPVLTSLARSNLLRGYSLSIPTGQAVCDAIGTKPLSHEELTDGEVPEIAAILTDAYFDHRTPLWYYILREAALQHGGKRLGEVGSRIVAETLIGLLKQDPNSYLNNHHDPAVKDKGIDVKPGRGGVVKDLIDFLKMAGYTGITP